MSMRSVNDRTPLTRRRFCRSAGWALATIAFAGACHRKEPQEEPAGPPATDGRIVARPRASTKTSTGAGPLGLSGERDAILQLPSQPIATALPLLVLLHGAGGSASGVLRRLGAAANEAGVAVLAPDSREQTWDALHGGFGPDVRFLNRALERVFDGLSVDPARLSIGGFSDGATYAISLGLINGDLFSRVLAFSPGFYVEGTAHERPRFYVSHGTADQILPIDRCSRRIVPRLQQRGYEVTFKEFEGGHEVPAAIAREGMRWAAGG